MPAPLTSGKSSATGLTFIGFRKSSVDSGPTCISRTPSDKEMSEMPLVRFDNVAIESSNSYLPMRIGRYSWCTRKSTSWMNRYVARCIFTRCWLRISRGAAPATTVGVLKSAATICSVPSVPVEIDLQAGDEIHARD